MPDVILDAAKLGIRAVPSVPDVILLAAKLGIRSVPNVPDVILLAAKLGIRSVPNVPELILDAAIEPLKDVALNAPVDELNVRLDPLLGDWLPVAPLVNTRKVFVSDDSSLTAICDAEPADISPTLIQLIWFPVEDNTCPESPSCPSLSCNAPFILI